MNFMKRKIIKNLIVYAICMLTFFQNIIGVNAEELSQNSRDFLKGEENYVERSDIIGEYEDIEEYQKSAELVEKYDAINDKERINGNKADELYAKDNDVKYLHDNEIKTELETDLSSKCTSENKQELSEKSSTVMNNVEDDPLYGRANGLIFADSYEAVPMLDEQEYVHNGRFENYIVHDVIDVSYYQGDIAWDQVKKSGIDYAIIRAAFRGYGDAGTLNTDPHFYKNIEGALNAGIQVGVYFFSQAITESESENEANYILNLIKDYNITLPVAIDYEYADSIDGFIGRLYKANLSKDEATKICKRFCETIVNNGYEAMVYANKYMLENKLNASEIKSDYKIWLGHYSLASNYDGEYDFWQYSNSGNVDGINTTVDTNFWYEPKKMVYVDVPEGIYTIGTFLNTGKVLDIPGAKFDNGLNIQIHTSNGTWAQKFYIRPEGEESFVIMSVNSGKVLEVRETNVVQKAYTGQLDQQWYFIENETGSYNIKSVSTGQLLQVKDGSVNNGTKIEVARDTGSSAQKFYLNIENDKLDKPENGLYIIETALITDKVLDLKSDNSYLQILSMKNSDYQKYYVRYKDDGCFEISTSNDTKNLTAQNDSNVWVEAKLASSYKQKWIFKAVDAQTYTIISAWDGKCLDVKGAKTTDGTPVQRHTGNGTTAQKFKFYKTETGDEELKDGIYVIHSALDYSKVVDISGGSLLSDANVQLYTSNGTDAQKYIIKRLENGKYSIYSKKSNMAMTVEAGKDANGTNVYQFYPVGGETQSWDIVPVGKGNYNIVSDIGDKVLDVAGAKTSNGTNIRIYTANGTKAQKFIFEKVGELNYEATEEKKIEIGTYKISSALNNSKVLDIKGGSLYSGANLQLHASNNSSAQKFVMRRNAKTGLYTITSKKSGMDITYANGILKNNTNVYQDSNMGNVSNQWNVKHVVGDYYILYAGTSKFCLDVSGAKTANGTNIQIYTGNGTKAQIFKIEKLSNDVLTEQDIDKELKEGVYTIASALSSKMVLDVDSGSISDGANIQLYTSNNSDAQKFIVRKMGNCKYSLTAVHSNKLVSVNGMNVCQQNDVGIENQQWIILPAGNEYYTIRSVQNQKVLDVLESKTINGTNIQTYTPNYSAAQRFKFTQTTTTAEAKFVSNGNDGYSVNYEVYTKGSETSADKRYYLMQADSYSGKIYGSPITSVDQNFEVSFNVQVADRSKLKELAMDKLVLAVKLSDGTYKAVTNPVSISNPEVIAKNITPIFKASSKKGIQGVTYASSSNDPHPKDARYTNTKQTLLNLDIAEVVNPESDYTTFTYKGKTYKFSKCSALVADIKSLNAGYKQYMYGNSGTTKVAVSLCLLLSYDSENRFLIDPAARSAGHAYYLLNVREDAARETLEALFVYLGELFGQNDCYVTNWILGNEINSSKAWNYGGSLNFDTYMNCYTTAFRMLYNAVKLEKTGNTVSISLDNGWTAAPDTYAGKTTLDSFAKKINAENPDIEWSIAYHPYSYPLTRVDFWNDSSNTTNSTSTKYISMKNISVLTDYAASLEKTYKMDTGSIRVLLTEQGYSYSGGADMQATAIARGYYIAEFNDRIDAFIIRALVDDAEEAKGKLYLGIMNGFTDKRTSFFVYEFMDSDLNKLKNTSASSVVTDVNYGRFNSAKNILCNTNWKSYVPGFNASKLAAIK